MSTTCPPEPTEGLRERKKEQTRRALHHAALEIIVEQGPEAATIEDITERAGVSRRTFFNYYPSRETVLTSSNPDALNQLVKAIHSAPEGTPVPVIVRRAVFAWVETAMTDTELVRLRKAAIEAWPEFSHMITMANTTLTKTVMAALLERPDVVDSIETRITLFAAMDVARSVYTEYAASGFTESLSDLMDRGFEALRRVAAQL